MQAARENKEKLREPGAPEGNKNAAETKVPKSENGTFVSRGSNQSSYRIRRLRRDHPVIAERLERGEFKSVAAAEHGRLGGVPGVDAGGKRAERTIRTAVRANRRTRKSTVTM
jgi:hypothetical protein